MFSDINQTATQSRNETVFTFRRRAGMARVSVGTEGDMTHRGLEALQGEAADDYQHPCDQLSDVVAYLIR